MAETDEIENDEIEKIMYETYDTFRDKKDKILIVEDCPEEALSARSEAITAGLEPVVMTRVEDACDWISNYRHLKFERRVKAMQIGGKEESCVENLYIASDLFLPIKKPITSLTLDFYYAMVQRYGNEIIDHPKNTEMYLKAERAYQELKDGKGLFPMGLLLEKRTGVPTVVVTSANRHDPAFKPGYDFLPAFLSPSALFDRKVDGKKDWKNGIQYLLANHREERQRKRFREAAQRMGNWT